MQLIKDRKKYNTATSTVVKEGVDPSFAPIVVDGKVYLTQKGTVFMTGTPKGGEEFFLTNDHERIGLFLDAINAEETVYSTLGIVIEDA